MILINGIETAALAVMDRGLAYGDGVFRTLLVRNGKPRHWSRHYAKLVHDCGVLGISCLELSLIADEAKRVSEHDGSCALKIIVTRGVSDRGYRYDTRSSTTRVIMSAPLQRHSSTCEEEGVEVRKCALKLAQQPALAGVKHLNRLENVLARAEWTDAHIAEGLLCDVEDNVIGGTMSNLFIVRDGELATPALDRCGVAGVTRDRVIDAGSRHGIACTIRTISWNDVVMAEELFLVNSLIGIWPVGSVEGRARKPGPVTRSLQRWLRQDDHAHLD